MTAVIAFIVPDVPERIKIIKRQKQLAISKAASSEKKDVSMVIVCIQLVITFYACRSILMMSQIRNKLESQR